MNDNTQKGESALIELRTGKLEIEDYLSTVLRMSRKGEEGLQNAYETVYH